MKIKFPCERTVNLSEEAERIVRFLERKGVVLKQFDDGEYDLFIELKKYITSVGGWVLSVNDNHLVCFIIDDSIEINKDR